MYSKQECEALMEASIAVVIVEIKESSAEYGTYEAHEVTKLIEPEAIQFKKVQTKTEWRDSEVYRFDEVFSLLNQKYDARNFQKVQAPKKELNDKKRMTKKELIQTMAED